MSVLCEGQPSSKWGRERFQGLVRASEWCGLSASRAVESSWEERDLRSFSCDIERGWGGETPLVPGRFSSPHQTLLGGISSEHTGSAGQPPLLYLSNGSTRWQNTQLVCWATEEVRPPLPSSSLQWWLSSPSQTLLAWGWGLAPAVRAEGPVFSTGNSPGRKGKVEGDTPRHKPENQHLEPQASWLDSQETDLAHFKGAFSWPYIPGTHIIS